MGSTSLPEPFWLTGLTTEELPNLVGILLVFQCRYILYLGYGVGHRNVLHTQFSGDI